jgi:tetratricopeptide (TPR) repeat protein
VPLLIRFFLLPCLALTLLTTTALAVPCPVDTPRPATPADVARIAYRFAEAEQLYATELKSSPDSQPALAGYTLSLLHEDKVSEAFAAAQKAIQQRPKDATLTAVFGEVEFRRANLKEAGEAFQSALALNPCAARAHFAIVRFLKANSMYASAQTQLEVAHKLAPEDSEITAAWRETRPISEQAAYFKETLKSVDLSEEHRSRLSAYVGLLEKRAEIERNGRCHVVSTVRDVTQRLVALMDEDREVQPLGLDVRLNDKATARLLFDTGASGIYVSHAIAERAGLKAFRSIRTSGIGDQADPTGYLALADDVRVGQIELKNCVVEVTDKKSVIDHEGLIGGDVFEGFLVTLDYPRKNIRFSQLPPRPGEAASASASTEIQTDAIQPLHDRYISPEMKDWVRVLRFDHNLVVPTTISDKETHMFILDTGAFSNIVDTNVANGVTKVSKTDAIVEGISGRVKEVRRGNTVVVQFGNLKARLDDVTLLDTSRFSRSMNFEIGGFVGFAALRFVAMQIDYRDGLVHFAYDRDQGFDH